MNLLLKFKAALTGFVGLKITQMILQLCVLSFSVLVQSRFKYIFEVNIGLLISFLLSILITYINYRRKHRFLYGEGIFTVIALMSYIPFGIFLSIIKRINIQEMRLASLEDLTVAQNNSEQPSIINMDARLAKSDNLFYKVVLPMILILLFQIISFILSILIIDIRESIRRKNDLNRMRNNVPTVVRGNRAIVNGNINVNNEVGNSYIINEILTNVNRSEAKIADPPPTYDEVVSQVPESVISFTPPPTYIEARKMRLNNLENSSLIEEGSEPNNLDVVLS